VETSRVIFFTFAFFGFIFFPGCKNDHTSGEENEPDLIVYCENGILGPVKEFTDYFEDSTGLNVSIQNDCARNLTSLIHYRREADIFIPDVKEAIDKLALTVPDIITDSVYLGNQTLVFIVSRSNPSGLTGTIESLTNPDNGIVLANPESSTLGHITSLLLKEHQIYDTVMNSVLFLTTDSRGLVRDIASNQASLAIAWKSDYLTNSVRKQVDTLTFQPAHKEYPTMAFQLSSAYNKKNAEKYLNMLRQNEAQKIFEKYGILKPD
jgi:molybdenum ABC transporter molybdate-binding protein